MSRRPLALGVALAAAALALASCATSGGGSSNSSTNSAPPTTPAAASSQNGSSGAGTSGPSGSATGSESASGASSSAGAPAASQSTGASTSQPAEKVNLTFQSLAFADTTVAATKKIVDSWNAANPNIQVKLVQGSWDNVHDQLVTQFQGGTAPDIIHDSSDDIVGFGQQGFLADLTPYLSSSLKSSVSQGVWDAVTVNGKVVGMPTIDQTYVVFANTKAFSDAGVALPAGKTLSWDDLQADAKKLTKNGTFGLGWGLKSPTAQMIKLSDTFGATWISGGAKPTMTVGDAEMQVAKRVHAMAYDDKSIDPTSLTQSGGDVLPAFYAGKFAMMVAGDYVAQQILEQAPKNFQWTVLPPLAGTTAAQPSGPQTLSVSATSKHPEQAAAFINYFMQDANLAAIAQGDWLIPTTTGARAAVQAATEGKNGWSQILASGASFNNMPILGAAAYAQWKDQIATPAYQQFLANKLDAGALVKQLQDGWSQVAGS
jgi:ABC-type glycerol-3-phosphate transport system substrate-binding protein